MKTRLAIAALVFLLLQGILFGAGAILVLATPLANHAMWLMPWVVSIATLAAIPMAWWLAPRLRARYWNEARRESTADRLLSELS